MPHLMGLGIVLEAVAAVASLWTETNPFGLIGSLAIGVASAAMTAMRMARLSTARDEQFEAAFRAEPIRR